MEHSFLLSNGRSVTFPLIITLISTFQHWLFYSTFHAATHLKHPKMHISYKLKYIFLSSKNYRGWKRLFFGSKDDSKSDEFFYFLINFKFDFLKKISKNKSYYYILKFRSLIIICYIEHHFNQFFLFKIFILEFGVIPVMGYRQ